MTDLARRTYPRNDSGPRMVDGRINRRGPDSPQRSRRDSTSISFGLAPIELRLSNRIQVNSRIGLKLSVTARNSTQLRHVNPQELVAVATLVDDRSGSPLPAGYLVPASSASRSRLLQPVGPDFEVAFEDLLVKEAGNYQIKVTLLRMPAASAAGGQATHIAEWESATIKVQGSAD